MYRDDGEALRSRVRVLEAELARERDLRIAAEADLRTALASGSSARRHSSPGSSSETIAASARLRRRLGLLAALGALAGLVVALGILIRSSDPATVPALEPEARGLRTLRTERAQLLAELDRMRKLSDEQGLLLRQREMKLHHGAAPAPPRDSGPSPQLQLPTASAQGPSPTGSAEVLLGQAQAAYVAGRHGVAAMLARQVLLQAPANEPAWQVLGASACLLGDEGEARQALLQLRPAQQQLVAGLCKAKGIVLPVPPITEKSP